MKLDTISEFNMWDKTSKAKRVDIGKCPVMSEIVWLGFVCGPQNFEERVGASVPLNPLN